MGSAGVEDAAGGSPSSGTIPGASPSVGKYQLLAILGRGGMADVFLALSRGPMGFNKLVVVKRLRGSLADDMQFRTMFLDEARLAARLNHPNVVHTYEVGAEDEAYFIAMEYLEGQSLNKIIKESHKRGEPFDQLLCARISSDALAGLHHAHELKDYDGTPLRIIHRDVSPHNIFVTYDGVVKVVDFGIAKAALSTVETEVGVLKGKVAYMSPEQAGGGPIDARADVFAMGIVLWELLTKQRLMSGDSAAATLHRLLMTPIPSVRTLRPDVDPELASILARALQKDPADRFQSAKEMRDSLDDYIARSGPGPRADDIGHLVSDMFQKVRDDIQRQIKRHMEGVTQVPLRTDEPTALARDSIKQGPAVTSTDQLPLLNPSNGSGSGVVANLAPPSPGFATFPPPRIAPADATAPGRKRSLALWLLFAATIGILALVALGVRKDGSPSSVVTATTAAATAVPSPDPVAATVPPPLPVTPPIPASAAVPAPAPPPAPIQPIARTTDPHPRHVPTTSRPQPPPPAPAPPAEEPGYLTFDTYPWTKVSENGRALGTTPLVHISLTAGPHTLTLENPDQGIKQTYSVTIKSGDTASHRLGLK